MNKQVTVPMAFAQLGSKKEIPGWASEMRAEQLAAETLASGILPAVLVLQAANFKDLDRNKSIVDQLSERIARNPLPVSLILHLAAATSSQIDRRVSNYLSAFRHFPGLAGRMDVALGDDDLRSRVLEAVAKAIAATETRQKVAKDPLSAALEVQETRSALVSPRTGRLDASKIADALGMSLAKVAALLGKKRATVTKTPDATALQEGLRPYERILRLKARLTDEKLLAWLEAPNRHLDDQTPRSLIEDGRADVVADLVEDALTGQPT